MRVVSRPVIVADGPDLSAEGKGGMVSSPPGREVLANAGATSCEVVGKY